MTAFTNNGRLQPGQTVTVLGGGIVGLSCAWYLRQKGLVVHVIDPGIATQRASYGNAGVLATCEALPLGTLATLRATLSMLRSPTGPLRLHLPYLPKILPWITRFVLSSRPSQVKSASHALGALLGWSVEVHQELAHATQASSLLVNHGWLKAYENDANYQASASERQTLQELGVPMQALSSTEIHDLCPAAQGFFQRATLYTGCRQVLNPGEYVARIEQACAAAGVQFHTDRARDFLFEDGRPTQVLTEKSRLRADAFVIATGAWSRTLVRRLKSDLPLDTEGGYHLMLADQKSATFNVPTFWSEKSLVVSSPVK